MTNHDHIIELTDLRKHFGDLKAVDGITFGIRKGEIFGMLGPNGAGKTTTMEIIVGLQEKTDGSVRVLGTDAARGGVRLKQRIGVQLQTVNLFPRLTVGETLSLFADFYDAPLGVDFVLDLMGLTAKRGDQVRNLSGGQLRRLAIGNAIIGNGDIIFLDEPTAGLDPQSKQKLWEVMGQLREMGKTIFVTTHFMEEAQKLCDRVCIIDHGRVIELDSPHDLIKKHFKETAVEIAAPLPQLRGELEAQAEVTRVNITDSTTMIYSRGVPATISRLLTLCGDDGDLLEDIRIRQSNLEDVFLKLTGRSIRE